MQYTSPYSQNGNWAMFRDMSSIIEPTKKGTPQTNYVVTRFTIKPLNMSYFEKLHLTWW